MCSERARTIDWSAYFDRHELRVATGGRRKFERHETLLADGGQTQPESQQKPALGATNLSGSSVNLPGERMGGGGL